MREKPLVLVVDDDENFLEIIAAKLSASGFDTAIGHNEEEGIAQAQKLMPDMILMDIRMPGASGTDAALAIKQNPKTRGIKIAFLTNLADPWPTVSADILNIAKDLGMEDYIEKSEDLDVIIQKVREVLSRK
ncbi:MAG: response regulator [Patescibacteria group bacterium]